VLFAVALLLSVMVRVALRALIADGVNVTLVVQLAPAGTEVPQVSISAMVSSPVLLCGFPRQPGRERHVRLRDATIP
jgi:hypothetical protein